MDHYLWFGLSRRDWNPLTTIRFFNEPDPPQHGAIRVLHGRWALLTTALLALRHRKARAALVGMAAHVALDAYHERRMDEMRLAALLRDDHTCRLCGARGTDLGTHLGWQPKLLPSYMPQHHITVCDTCHEAAHDLGAVAA